MRTLTPFRRIQPTLRAGLALAGVVLLAYPAAAQVAVDPEVLRGRAGQGDPEALNALGNAYTNGAQGFKQDYAEALRLFRQAAEKGYAPAQYNLGLCYELGRGVAVDARQAFKYYLMSAEQGFTPAQFNVGNMYAEGRGVGQDFFEANLWYKQAADSGLAEAQYNLGLGYEQARGVKKDESQAARWYKAAADHGYAPAQFRLGILNEEGRGVTKDPAAAVALYRAAAEKGFAPAQVNYGVALADGRPGVAQDVVQALAWLTRAVQNGAKPEARDALAARLSPDQRAAANRLLGAAPVQAPAASGGSSAAVADLTDALNRAREANDRFAAENQRLEAENVRLAQELSQGGDSAKLVAQLRDQSRRLASQVESLTSDKEAAERQNTILAAQVRDAQQDLARAKSAPASAASPAQPDPQVAALSSRLEQANAQLKQLQNANAQLTEANQRLQQEKAALASAPKPAAETGKPGEAPDATAQASIIANLQRDNARLNDEVKRSTRELLSLNTQLRSLRNQPAKPAAGADPATADQVAQLTARVQQAAADAEKLEGENRRLAARVTELERAPKPSNDNSGAAKLADAQRALTALQQQLATVQAEKADLEKWAKSLEANVNEQAAAAKLADAKLAEFQQKLGQVQGQLADRESSLASQKDAADRLTEQNRDLAARLARTESDLRAAASRKADTGEADGVRQELASARTQLADLEQQNQAKTDQLSAAQRDLKSAETRRAELEQALAAAKSAQPAASAELSRARADLADATRKAEQLAAAVTDLTKGRDALQGQLVTAQGAVAEAQSLREALAQAKAQAADLQRDLAAARQQSTSTATGTDNLKQQLAEANQALDKSGATVAELTAANEKLERDLASARAASSDGSGLRDELARARRDLVEMATLRDENIRLRSEAAAVDDLRSKNEQLKRDAEQLTAFMSSNRSDLDKAQARVADLEKQLADALTVRTAGGGAKKLQADLDEANRTVERLNGTIADLTAANEKLEKDLDNAQKSTAAALAAQTQAVSAAAPDAYQSEIATLNSRIKQLETQVEDERTNAAKEVATLANQLQRTRETNKSLTDANRALLAAKDSDTSATRDEIEQLQARVKELSSLNDDLRRQGLQHAADMRAITFERDELKSQLVDAHKVATTLPGLADEKVALQERLEAVGGQLVQLQRDHDEVQKTNADLTQQLAATRQMAEKAQGDLAALQAKVAEAEKADESHTQSVAELTDANTKLEREREDMRRLVESYRNDINRLTQNVRAAEQQKADADRGAQQNIDAVTAQMAQLRRDLELARANQARQTEAFSAQERERVAIITQLRTENGALAARLNQAQGTLDQIAAAARLGTPASAIASGTPVPARPVPTVSTAAPEVRYHTVVEGDSLSRISMRYYGTPNRWQEIYQANRDVLQGSSALRVGQQLRIP